MATLYVENVPDDLYDALRRRARSSRKSIAQEVIAILATFVPTPAELASRKRFVQQAVRLSSKKSALARSFPSAEQMLQEDRRR